MSIKFENNSIQIKAALNEKTIAFLHEASGEIESQVKRNTAVDTGQTKGSWSSKVDEGKGEATIGSSLENAIWEEFGTGQYALMGGGRKKPWVYKDIHGNWHRTTGKRPKRALTKAFQSVRGKLEGELAEKLKGL